MKKKALGIFLMLCGLTSQACWYSKSNYTDYIYTVNDKLVMEQTVNQQGVNQYTISNNQVVDFPLTVSMKLISNDRITLNDGSKTDYVRELINGKLQYRILPNGKWITVEERTQPLGFISKDSKPGTFFGKNNIWPKGCKEGDVLMIRLYVTDGMWQSGVLNNVCADKLQLIVTEYGDRISLPNTFTYTMNGVDLLSKDLGGAWYPHLCVTVIYSGRERPIR